MIVQESESNNSIPVANSAQIQDVIAGQINQNADADYFRITAPSGGLLAMDFSHPNGVGTTGKGILLQIRDAAGNVILGQTFNGSGQLHGTLPFAGTYYLTASDNDGLPLSGFAPGAYSLSTTLTTDSASAYDGATNNTIQSAIGQLADSSTPLAFGVKLFGTLSENADSDYFRITAASGGLVTLNFAHPNGVGSSGKGILLSLVDSDGKTIIGQTFKGDGQLNGTLPKGGDYFLAISDNDGLPLSGFAPGLYSIASSLANDPLSAYDGAANNTAAGSIDKLGDGATMAVLGNVVTGTLSDNADTDYFKLSTISGAVVTLDFSHPNGLGINGKGILVQLRDAAGNVIVGQTFSGTGQLKGTVPSGGEYFLAISDNDGLPLSGFAPGVYSVATSVSADPSAAFDGAVNDNPATAVSTLGNTATPLAVGNKVVGTLSGNADVDYFRLTSASGGVVALDFSHPNGPGSSGKGILLQLHDAANNVIVSQTFVGDGQLMGTVPVASDYYLSVADNDGLSLSGFAPGVYSISSTLLANSNTAFDGAVNSSLAVAQTVLGNGASPITVGNVIKGTLGANKDIDYFKFNLMNTSPLNISFTHPDGPGDTGKGILVEVRDAGDHVVASQTFKGNGLLNHTPSAIGDTYLAISDNDGLALSGFADGIYSLAISTSATVPNSGVKSLFGTSARDVFQIDTGRYSIDGGAGIDTAVFPQQKHSYTLTRAASSISLRDETGAGVSHDLNNVERVHFVDRKLAFDLGPTENAGNALQFIGTLAYPAIQSAPVIGLILSLFDQGQSMHDVCQFAVDIGLVKALAGSDSNVDVARLAFRNVVGVEANDAIANVLAGLMQGSGGAMSQADFLAAIAVLEINQTHVNLVGLQSGGVEFI